MTVNSGFVYLCGAKKKMWFSITEKNSFLISSSFFFFFSVVFYLRLCYCFSKADCTHSSGSGKLGLPSRFFFLCVLFQRTTLVHLMFSLLLELFISLVLCGVFAFFAFLNAPVDAGATTTDDDGSVGASAADGACEPALLAPHELPLYSVLSTYVTLGEDTPCGIAYRWLLINALHYTPREVYSEAQLREWGSGVGNFGPADDETGGSTSSSSNKKSVAASNSEESSGMEVNGLQRYGRASPSPSTASPSPSAAAAAGGCGSGNPTPRRSRRRHRRGGPLTATAPRTPTRHESAHWVNVVLRWAAFLCLGGGTVKPEVWTDHLLYHVEGMLGAVNAGYAEKMRARAAVVRLVASQLSNAGGQPSPSPQQQQQPLHSSLQEIGSSGGGGNVYACFPPSTLPLPPFYAPRALVRVETLELGAGLLGGPAREVRRPQLSTTADGLLSGGGKRVDGAGALPGNVSPSLASTAPANPPAAVVNPLNSPTLGAQSGPATSPTVAAAAATAAPLHSNSNGGSGTAASNSPALSNTHPSKTTTTTTITATNTTSPHAPPPHNTAAAIAAASVLLPNSIAGLTSALANVVSSVTTAANAGGGGGGVGEGGVAGDYGASNMSAGAQLGVVLPRVEGDVISVEQPYANGETHTVATSAASPPALPLRCFAVPLLYEDQRFHLRLGCCLPLGALLPVSLCVPPDVLTLDCAVAVRRVIFNGHLYAALHGAQVELSFPVAPQFTAVVEVMPDNASGGSGSTSASSNYHSYPDADHLRYGMGAGVARTLGGHAFTAVNTTRNEVSAAREGGVGVGNAREAAGPSSLPPRPPRPPSSSLPFTPRSGVYSTYANNFYKGLHSAAAMSSASSTITTTGTSSINERNEKVQEVVLLAVRRLIQSLTYPNVLAGQLVCEPAVVAEGGDVNGSLGGGAVARTLAMRWQRTTAKLPLRL